jgi:two-component system NtrC family sensor kinase
MRQAVPGTRRSRRPLRGRILVVDDEPIIAQGVRHMLRDYALHYAGSVDEAVSLLGRDRDFGLILCDVMMPGKLGTELYAWLAQEHPELLERFVFITGGVKDPRARSFLDQHAIMVLNKPFDSAILRHLLTEPRRETLREVCPPSRGWDGEPAGMPRTG